jgi:beta-glucosidase
VRRVSEVNPKVAVVLTAGGNVDMNRWADGVQAVLHSFFPGQAGGQAVAEILFGQVNPSGRLPATFEKRLEDRSSFDSYHDDDGDLRVALTDGIWSGYRHFDARGIEPRYPFGYGLSYTSFSLSELSLSTGQVEPGSSVTASVSVTNTGERAGAQVVQLYVGQVEPRVERPVKQLAGFARVELEPGETRRVEVALAPRSFEVYDVERHDWVFEPGRYRVLAGEHAGSVPLTAELEAV